MKTSVQLGHAVAHTEWVGPPGYEHTLRIHMDREVRQQQHISFLRAKPWPHRLIYPATSCSTAFRWECIRSRGAVTRHPSRGKFTSRITRHGQSDDPRANVSSVGPCTEDHSDQLLASVEAACDPCDRDRVTDMITRKGQVKLVDASPALSQTSMQTCVHVSNSGRQNNMRKHQRAHLHRRLSGKSRPTRATGPVSGNNLHNLLARRPINFFFTA